MYFLFPRHNKLKAELAAMTWKVKWEDITFAAKRVLTKGSSRLSLNRVNIIYYYLINLFLMHSISFPTCRAFLYYNYRLFLIFSHLHMYFHNHCNHMYSDIHCSQPMFTYPFGSAIIISILLLSMLIWNTFTSL